MTPGPKPDGSDCVPEQKRLADYFADAKALSTDAFSARHAMAFLLHFGDISTLELPRGIDQTLLVEPGPDERESPNPQADFLVFPVKRKQSFKREGQEIYLGRTDDNDIVLPDVSVSARHALIYSCRKNGFEILDGGSRNGTLLDGQPVPIVGRGDSMKMRSGARLRIGRLGLTFLKVAEFHSLVELLAG